MLALKPKSPSENPLKTLNLLPCEIQHDGPIEVTKRYWNPQPQKLSPSSSCPKTDSETQVSYLRGRKLLGRTVALPAGYEGALLQRTDEVVPERAAARPTNGTSGFNLDSEEDEEGEEDGDLQPEKTETRFMDRIAGFEEIVVWGHDQVLGDDDAYIKGLEEWVGFAETLHGYEEPKS